MTLSTLEAKEVRKYLGNPGEDPLTISRVLPEKTKPLTGKSLALRLEGVMSREKANQLDRHISESCEQVDD